MDSKDVKRAGNARRGRALATRGVSTSTDPPGGTGGGTGGTGVAGTSGGSGVDKVLTFPVLVEPITPGGPGGAPSTTGGYPGAGMPGGDVGGKVAGALRDVLGWQPRPGDAKGFVGALIQSFDLREVEGRVEAIHRERRFAVQSDLSGGISGAQASLLRRARLAVDDALPVLEALYSLRVDADPEDVDAVRAIVSSQLRELVYELGVLGGPRIARVDQIFLFLLGDGPTFTPDNVDGTVGELRDLLGLGQDDDLVNTVEEELNLTNFRVLADYVITLRQSWIDNRAFFSRRTTNTNVFFGTQLVLLSRQLSVVAESVGELRIVLDSVFIGALERQTLLIQPAVVDPDDDPENDGEEPIFLEELLGWIETFATREGPQLIERGGKLGVDRVFEPTARRLQNLVAGVRAVADDDDSTLPDGFQTQRVRRALLELEQHLKALADLAGPIDHETSASDAGDE